MEEGDFQPEDFDFNWDGLEQLLLSGDNAWPQVAIDESSSPSFIASSSIFLSNGTTTTATPNTSLSQPNTYSNQPGADDVSHTMASEGAVADLDSDALDELLSGENPWLQVATIASSSTSFFDSPSTLPSDTIDNWGAPASTNSYLIQPSIPTMSSQGAAVDLDLLDNLLSGDNAWPQESTDASSSSSFLASPSIFPSDAETITETPSCPNILWIESSPIKDAIHYFLTKETLNYYTDVPPVGAGLELSVYRGEHNPECVQLLSNYDYGRKARLPVFEKGNNSCLGVIEFMTMTTQELNFTSVVDAMTRALQAFNLTTTQVSSIPRTMFNGVSYMDALPEILQVLRAACIIHKLPLAQTWATCAQQGKWGRQHSHENYRYCISTIDAACYVNDPRMQNFHKACSKLHLLPGQGVVGKAFTTNQPFFLPDIGSLTKPEYPLPHDAKIFRLKGAVAIRLRCSRTGMADFVLEFFLPTDCGALGEQKAVLDSLWGTVQSLSRTLRLVADKEVEDDKICEMNEINSLKLQKKKSMKRKPMARRSHVWKSFTEVMVGDTAKAMCNHCGLPLCCDSKNGTSSLASHLRRCKLNPDRISAPI